MYHFEYLKDDLMSEAWSALGNDVDDHNKINELFYDAEVDSLMDDLSDEVKGSIDAAFSNAVDDLIECLKEKLGK